MEPRTSHLPPLLGRIVALAMLLLVSPLFIILALMIRFIDKQSIFFRQVRVGKGGKPFTILKFRTMKQSADPYAFKPEDDDPVITPVGHIVRGRAMDEIPQLINVITGKMALVGPRPEMQFIVDGYGPVERMRLRVRPGVTGLWQLSRVRERLIHEHMEYDLFYVFNRSWGLDLWLIWRTFLFAMFGTPTKIRTAVQRWERDPGWRNYVPERSAAIPRRTGPLLWKVWLGTAITAFIVLVAPALLMAQLAKADLNSARSQFLQARSAIKRLEPVAANTALDRADTSITKADARLTSWLTLGGRIVPGIAQNLNTADDLAIAGKHLVAAGREGVKVLGSVPIQNGRLAVPWHEGSLDLAPLVKAADPARTMREQVIVARDAIEGHDRGFLIPPVKQARHASLSTLQEATRQTDAAVGAAVLIPKMLGAERPRTWILGAENNAELRGRGGYLGSFGLLKAQGGKLSLEAFQATDQLPKLNIGNDTGEIPQEYLEHYVDLGGLAAWQNLFMSPSFPSGSKLFLSQLHSKMGIDADGVISLDPIALSYLLEITGPVQVPGLPDKITAENLVDISLNKIYFTFDKNNAQRKEQLALIAGAIWDKVLNAKDLDPRKLGEALGKGVSQRHLVLYSSNAEEQQILERLGLAGNIDSTDGDYMMLLAQNVGENKMDYYLRRSVKYRGEIGLNGTLHATAEITVVNNAPQGVVLPGYVGGERKDIGLAAGKARDFVSLFVPARAELTQVLVDGKKTDDFDNDLELGKRRLAAYVELAPGEKRVFTFGYDVPKAMQGGRYSLSLQNQALVAPDTIDIQVKLPPSAKVFARAGFKRGLPLHYEGPVDRDFELTADVNIPFRMRLATKLASILHRPVTGTHKLSPGSKPHS